MPTGNTTVILQATGPKVRLEEVTAMRPYMKGKVSVIEENMTEEDTDEFKALLDTCKELSAKLIELSEHMRPTLRSPSRTSTTARC